MINWIINNAATIIICAVLICIVAAVIINQVKSKKSGKSSCGHGCANCAMHGECHKR